MPDRRFCSIFRCRTRDRIRWSCWRRSSETYLKQNKGLEESNNNWRRKLSTQTTRGFDTRKLGGSAPEIDRLKTHRSNKIATGRPKNREFEQEYVGLEIDGGFALSDGISSSTCALSARRPLQRITSYPPSEYTTKWGIHQTRILGPPYHQRQLESEYHHETERMGFLRYLFGETVLESIGGRLGQSLLLV